MTRLKDVLANLWLVAVIIGTVVCSIWAVVSATHWVALLVSGVVVVILTIWATFRATRV